MFVLAVRENLGAVAAYNGAKIIEQIESDIEQNTLKRESGSL